MRVQLRFVHFCADCQVIVATLFVACCAASEDASSLEVGWDGEVSYAGNMSSSGSSDWSSQASGPLLSEPVCTKFVATQELEAFYNTPTPGNKLS